MIECPRCKKAPLFLVMKHTHVFAVESIGLVDVVPGEKVEAGASDYLECMECGFKGWTDEYNQCKNGVIPLFPEGGTHNGD